MPIKPGQLKKFLVRDINKLMNLDSAKVFSYATKRYGSTFVYSIHNTSVEQWEANRIEHLKYLLNLRQKLGLEDAEDPKKKKTLTKKKTQTKAKKAMRKKTKKSG